ncbi:GNAT family N-acetyltransferase [Brachybacterium aquaticum]|uniref:Ribosomal protein S18 acetylase RimI-like enzyme n=1 Tax=Brachybacterium aquaticum TaxID=1432564 RepID=A0A841AG86_9MICO|nr:GNAT family N-acetyltransferase [Brachybacterium aquaticum]MBB5832345.1 ribosomal protein S18 acetylase RimI-like enzyme [Brachybacterium aquaticum]
MTAEHSTHRAPAPTPALTLREAREEDVPAIVEVTQAAYRGEGGWTTEADLVDGHRTDDDGVSAMLADPAVVLLVAADEAGAVRGCCYTRRAAPEADGRVVAELGLFAVDPSLQGAGLGRRLLEAQAEQLAARGVDVLMIQVLQSRPELHAWYERRGFVRTGRTNPFPVDPSLLKVPGLGMDVMERPLPLV